MVHLHEWHTAVVGLLYWDMYHQMGLYRPRLVLTIHNMEHQGECKGEELTWCGLDGQLYATVERVSLSPPHFPPTSPPSECCVVAVCG